MSVRLHFIVEGQTEETFINRVIIPHLASCRCGAMSDVS